MSSNPQASSAPHKAKAPKATIPTSKAGFQRFMKDHKHPDNWEFSKASASEWGLDHLHKCAVRVLEVRTPEFGEGDKYGSSSSADLEKSVNLVELLGIFPDFYDLFLGGDQILKEGGCFAAFYFSLREMFLFNSTDGRKKKAMPATSAQTTNANMLIMSGKRTRTQTAVHDGIVSGELLESLHLIDEEDPTKDIFTPTHKRNASDGSFQVDVTTEEEIESMAERVVDEGIASSGFNVFCSLSQAFLESYTPPNNGFTVRYTLHPVSYHTKTAFGAFRARSDGTACLHRCSQSAGYSPARDESYEKLFLIEAKAFEGSVADPQQFAQCLSFIASRFRKLLSRGYTLDMMKKMPKRYWEVYIVCINQMKYQLKRVRFLLEYLALVLGENEIDGGAELQKFNTQLECFDAKQTYIHTHRVDIVRELNALCKQRTTEVLELSTLPAVPV